MPLEPELPFEFVVRGTAVSMQGSSKSLAAWRETVRTAARAALPEGSWLLSEPLAVVIYIFPRALMRGDIDNRVKPILDAMVRCVYSDDEIIERLVVQKFEPGGVYSFRSPSAALLAALEVEDPVVYIQISNDLQQDPI